MERVAGIWPWRWEGSDQTQSTASLWLLLSLFLTVAWWRCSQSNKRGGLQLPLPPGPRGLPVVGSLPFLDPELHVYFAGLARKYGPIASIRLGSKLGIVVSSPSTAREVLKHHDDIFANRDVPMAATVSSYGERDVVWTSHGPEWRMLRKICVRELLGPAGQGAVRSLRRREVRRMVANLYGRQGTAVSVGEEMFVAALNMTTGMLWGGALEGGEELWRVVGDLTDVLGKANVSDFFPGLARFDVQGVVRQMREPMKALDRIYDEIIAERQKKGRAEEAVEERSKDFVELMLELIEEEGDGEFEMPLTITHLKGMLTDMIVGGTDTTSNTVEWVMAEMMNRPEVVAKAQEELDAVAGRDGVIEESHLPSLRYVSAVVKEGLRLHPVVPLLVPHCPSRSCAVGGYAVPEGARVFINAWAIHRDPSIWTDPSRFEPERFLRGGERWGFRGEDFRYLPFGSGRRMCAGVAMAERMVTHAVAALVHSFDWCLAEGAGVDLSEKFGIVLKKASPLMAVPRPRLSDPRLYLQE